MIKIVIKTLQLLGINRAITYGLLTRFWGLISGPLTMLIIVSRLTKEEQGFYYTIGSLLALQVFFELGLTNVIAQFTSHEFANLTWKERGVVEGDAVALARFEDLLCKSVKWFVAAALILVIFLIPAGLYFFQSDNASSKDLVWRLPWVLAVLGTALNLVITPFFALIMGSGDVTTTNHRQMLGAVLGSIISWVVMWLYGGLYAIFAVTLGNFTVSWWYVVRHKPALLRLAWHGLIGDRSRPVHSVTINWSREIWPMQWRVALSWISGYFVFQMFTPVLFHYHGALVAGQMGMTLSASNALMAASLTWLAASAPEFGKLVAKREWKVLDQRFKRVFWQSLAVVTVGSCTAYGIIRWLQAYSAFGVRFIPSGHAAILFAAIWVQIIISSLATYMRAHKQEPLFAVAMIAGLIQGPLMLYLGNMYSTLGVTSCFLAINTIVILPLTVVIWSRFKRKLHN